MAQTIPALQASMFFNPTDPGRWPGLRYRAPLALEPNRPRSPDFSPTSNRTRATGSAGQLLVLNRNLVVLNLSPVVAREPKEIKRIAVACLAICGLPRVRRAICTSPAQLFSWLMAAVSPTQWAPSVVPSGITESRDGFLDSNCDRPRSQWNKPSSKLPRFFILRAGPLHEMSEGFRPGIRSQQNQAIEGTS